jgi:hypothetical protein
MTGYIKAPDMWDPKVQAAVISGALKLRPGQRIRCGTGRTSIFAGVTAGGTVWAVHWNGKGYNWEQFRALRQSLIASGRA